MNPIAICAEQALRTHTHPALRLRELLELVSEQIDRGLEADTLRAVLEEHPERFCVLEPWSGPWRVADARLGRRTTGDAWVVATNDPGDPPDAPNTALRLRESVRWLAQGVDGRSPVEVSRWYAIVLAERAAREAVVRRAA